MSEAAAPIQINCDDSLPCITEAEFRENAKDIIERARYEGLQVAIIDDAGKVIEIVGMNGIRILPEPDVVEDEPVEEAKSCREDFGASSWVE